MTHHLYDFVINPASLSYWSLGSVLAGLHGALRIIDLLASYPSN